MMLSLLCRRVRAGGAGLIAVLVLGGCYSVSGVRDEIISRRRAAFDSWQAAREGRGIAELNAPLDPAQYEEWRRKHGDETVVLKGRLDIDSAVLIAIGNNKGLRAVLEEKEKAAGRVTEAYSRVMPRVDLKAAYSRTEGLIAGPKDKYELDVVLSQPIFHGGAIEAGIRAAKLGAYLAEEQIAAAAQDVVFQTRQGYYDVLLAQELVKVSEGDLALSKAHLEDVRKKRAAGVASQYDVLRASVEVSNVEATLIQRQNALHLAVTSLLKTLGVSQESAVELSGRLEYAPVTVDMKKAVEAAFRDRPEILQAELGIRINEEAVAQARSGFWPRLDAVLTHIRSIPHPFNPLRNEWDQGTIGSIALTWPVFDGLGTRGRVRQAKASLRQSRIQLSSAEEQVLLDVKRSLLSLEDAEKFVKSQSANLDRAKEGLDLAQKGYNAGVNTELEMLDARQALSETQALYYQAVYRHETAKLSLERATGALKKLAGGIAP